MAVLQSESIRARDCETATKSQREIYGCDNALPKGSPGIWQYNEIIFDRCHCFYLNDVQFRNMAFEIFNWSEKGFLPYPGTWLEQSNKTIEIINLVGLLQTERWERERTNIRNRTAAKR